MDPEADSHEAWNEQVVVYAAQGPTDHTQSPRYYLVAAAVVIGLVAIVLVAARVVPSDEPTTTTVPPLTFPTRAP